MKKYIYISLGIFFVILGAIGIVTPGLPGTPFLLLATFLFSRSSSKLNDMLLKNKVLGRYISNYFNNVPVPLKDKLISIAFFWAGIGATFYFATLSGPVFVILIIVTIGVTFHLATLGMWRRKK